MITNPRQFVPIFYHGARILLGGVFVYASVHKILNPESFAQTIFNYQILPDSLINMAAIILPWIELTAGCCLILGRMVAGASVIVAFLMVVFLSALGFNLARGLDVNCGCFSAEPVKSASVRLTVLRDAFFLLVSFFVVHMVFAKKKETKY